MDSKTDHKKNIEETMLKVMLASYIMLAFILAGLNFGYAGQAPAHIATLIKTAWHFYENELKTIYIGLGGYLTIRIIAGNSRTTMRKRNLIGFLITALAVHISGPRLLEYTDLYYFAMPLPWTNQPLQLLVAGSDFNISFLASPGIRIFNAVLILYFTFTAFVFIGTMIRGRRWQCSTLCLFSGFVSEVFSPVFPLIGKKKKISPRAITLFAVLRWVFFSIALFFSGFWLLQIAGVNLFENLALITRLENYKYLIFDLIAALFIWAFLSGRGYCFYCPLGTVTALLGRLAGQQIKTDLTECIKCRKCNQACPMAIDILSCAREAKPVISLNCVGCGHCIDSCPKQTLAYVTKLSPKKS